MVWRDVPLGRWLRAVSIAAAPLALGFIVLAALGLLAPGVAALTWLGLTLISAAAIHWLLGDLLQVKNQLEQLVRGGAVTAASARTRIGRELTQSGQRAEREIGQRTARLRSDVDGMERALDALPGPVLLLNEGHKVVRANRASENLLGGELAGRDMSAVLRNPDVVAALEEAERTGAGQDAAFTLQAPVRRHFSARIEPLKEHAADGTAIVLALVDMTAVRRADQMRADFVANASHEIRTPLATLSGFIETLSGPAKDDAEARGRFLAIMAQHAERMTRLVEDLLSLSRIEMNEQTPPTDRVDLPAVLATVATNLEFRAAARAATIEQDIAAGLPPLTGDAGELTQLFQNLVDNAIKYGGEGGTVRIRAWHEASDQGAATSGASQAGDILVSIADEGDGIARQHLPRLTERFYRVDTARSRELGGTGLGLAIVKHVASRHRATLAIESETGKGSIFTLRFPHTARTPQQD
ncbi:MAG: ATP-binding protein [Proteobacteria bacterium]|nr:ATP-binding protein [Pseudomonadota bacterium]MDA1356259.1 ATP-binding protein [Pseudomonadota bacterium]